MMKRWALCFFVGAAVFCLGRSGSEGAIEARLQARIDPNNGSDESPVAGLVGLGYRLDEALTVGLYTSYQSSDRDLPVKSSRIYGFGAYSEYDLASGYRLQPFIGASLGVMAPTGPRNSPALHVVGTLGLKYALLETVDLSASVNGHWASQDYFDYERHGAAFEDHSTDLTADLAVRYLF